MSMCFKGDMFLRILSGSGAFLPIERSNFQWLYLIVQYRRMYWSAHRSSMQAWLHDLLESDPVAFEILFACPRVQILHLAKAQGYTRKGFR